MIKLLQINSRVNYGSVSRIAEQIGAMVINDGWESHIAYAREMRESQSHLIKIGNSLSIIKHKLLTLLFDRHGLGSVTPTKKLIEEILSIQPDIIHIHNIHGYYINYKLLFDFLHHYNKPVVWTMHDCWGITGHCAHFMDVRCDRWKSGCNNCPQIHSYPCSLFVDNSKNNYKQKKNSFSNIERLTLVPVSDYLANQIRNSYLADKQIVVIKNGIDLSKFNINNNYSDIKEKYDINYDHILLGVASIWTKSKGFNDFISFSKYLMRNECIVLLGVSRKQIKQLPNNIIGIERTDNIEEMAKLYSMADCFVNLTYSDTYPTVNMEAIACGTPVITYRTGGSPEVITKSTGRVIEQGDFETLRRSINELRSIDKGVIQHSCRQYALSHFDKNIIFNKYLELYKYLLNSTTTTK